jgi:tetratricopeptide (TPR) repeat protein
LHELQQNQEADASFGRAIQLRRQVAAEDPNDFHARSELEAVLRIAAVAKCQAGEIPAATQFIQEAAAAGNALHRHDPSNLDETVSVSLDYYELGEVLRKRASEHSADSEDWQAALSAFQRSQALLAQVPPAAIYDASDREKLAKLPARIRECSQRALNPQSG